MPQQNQINVKLPDPIQLYNTYTPYICKNPCMKISSSIKQFYTYSFLMQKQTNKWRKEIRELRQIAKAAYLMFFILITKSISR